jgi:hypothetical protein
MPKSNFERLIELATVTFAAHNDPEQLDIDETVMEQLQKLHPSTIAEYNVDGPAIWVLLIPTTNELMKHFLAHKIGEKELLNQTIPGTIYNALYLCSALTLPEFRNKGLTKKLALDAIAAIRKTHPIESLFVWGFSEEGEGLAKAIAEHEMLPLYERK